MIPGVPGGMPPGSRNFPDRGVLKFGDWIEEPRFNEASSQFGQQVLKLYALGVEEE